MHTQMGGHGKESFAGHFNKDKTAYVGRERQGKDLSQRSSKTKFIEVPRFVQPE
jgi:hypothetical protein